MRIAVIDLETTGTDPARHHLWEIGLIVREPDAADVEYCWQVRPDLSTADPMALKISGYYNRGDMIRDLNVGAAIRTTHPDMEGESPIAAEVAAEIAHWCAGATLAAANVAFDAAFLDKFLRANGQAPAWDYHLLEIESYAAGQLGMEPPWKLDQLATALGVPLPPERHEALVDARLARDVYDAARRAAL